MTEALRQRALELATNTAESPEQVIVRATAYHTFLANAAGNGAKPAASTAAAKPAATAAAKPATAAKPAAAAKPATAAKPAAAAKLAAAPPKTQPAAKVGKHSIDDVRNKLREIAKHPALGMDEAMSLLEEETGVRDLNRVDPKKLDLVYDAAQAALNNAGGAKQAAAEPEPSFDGDGDGGDDTAGDEFDATA